VATNQSTVIKTDAEIIAFKYLL